MQLDSDFPLLKEKVLNCIEKNLALNVKDIPISYVNNFEFYKCIKINYKLDPEYFNDVEKLKKRYQLYCEMICGLYKWNEKRIYIKEEEKYNFSLLLTELLHSKSITQGKIYIEDWIKEGLIHYIAKVLCERCNIPFQESGHSIYFSIWERIHKKYDLNVLKKILFTEHIKISLNILKNIFRYEKNDIFEISFKKAKKLVNLIV